MFIKYLQYLLFGSLNRKYIQQHFNALITIIHKLQTSFLISLIHTCIRHILRTCNVHVWFHHDLRLIQRQNVSQITIHYCAWHINCTSETKNYICDKLIIEVIATNIIVNCQLFLYLLKHRKLCICHIVGGMANWRIFVFWPKFQFSFLKIS